MLDRFFRSFNSQGSNGTRFESASCCASFFAALLLIVDTAFAVSIFVSADILGILIGILVSILVCLIILRALLLALPELKRSKPSAA